MRRVYVCVLCLVRFCGLHNYADSRHKQQQQASPSQGGEEDAQQKEARQSAEAYKPAVNPFAYNTPLTAYEIIKVRVRACVDAVRACVRVYVRVRVCARVSAPTHVVSFLHSPHIILE